MPTKIIKLLFPLLLCYGLDAQQVISTAGGYSKKDSNSASWTIGEPLVITLKADDKILTQGFQQTSLIFLKSMNLSSSSFEVSAYPNPTSDKVLITWYEADVNTVRISVLSSDGAILSNYSVNEKEKLIDLSFFAAGIYFIRIDTDSLHEAIKVVKQ